MAVRIFSTCPPSKDIPSNEYLATVADVAAWSEDAGCEGILVYTDNGLVDPWLVSQAIIDATDRLAPLVAVQPVYMHPYSVAKMVTSLAHLHGRRVYLNMLAGGFKNDLEALGDATPHDERYTRMAAYTRLVLDLLAGDGAVTVDDEYHQVTNLRLQPPLPEELMPGVLVSGSSPAGLAAAHALGATPVKYPHPPGDEQASDSDEDFGVRVGIVARDTTDEAWQVALERFPEDRAGQITHKLAMKVSDSHWHHQLSGRAESSDRAGSERDGSGRQGREGRLTPYWLGPFRNYRTFCPYLVGDHETVGDYLAHYRRLGASTFIFDVPPSREELGHVEAALALADKQLANEQIDARGEAVT